MKKLLQLCFFIFLTVSFSGCDVFPKQEVCEEKTGITAPSGFRISLHSSIQYNGTLKEIQFVSANVGFILGTNNVWGLADVFRTTNGGVTWTNLNLQNSEIPINMFFFNDQIGFISYFGSKGNILITTDGGTTWTKKDYQYLNGTLYHIQKDNNNNLYAILGSSNPVLIKSTDQAESWEIINDSPVIGFSQVTFSFKVVNDRIYVSGDNGRIIVTDLDGNELQVLQTTASNIRDMEVVDAQNIYIANTQGLIRTTDGGTTWYLIYNSSSRILGFTTPTRGFTILNKGYCQSDVFLSSDVIASTDDGGAFWTESEETTNLISYFADKEVWGNGGYLLLVGNNLYRLENE
jgi:photosystem II stability/assembly factor-like uncharacterized protein